MFTEAVFESVLAEYTKEGIDVGGMTFEDNSAVVALIEGNPGGANGTHTRAIVSAMRPSTVMHHDFRRSPRFQAYSRCSRRSASSRMALMLVGSARSNRCTGSIPISRVM